MKNIIAILIICCLPAFLLAQTSIEEYNFLATDYAKQKYRGFDPELEGYYIQELFEMVDKTGKVVLLYKDEQMSYVPVASQIQVKDGKKTYYLCIPHEDSGLQVMDKSVDDEQVLLEVSETVRKRYSKIRALYPKQLERYYKQLEIIESNANNSSGSVKEPKSLDRSLGFKSTHLATKGAATRRNDLPANVSSKPENRISATPKHRFSSEPNHNRFSEPENISLNELQRPLPNRKRGVGQHSDYKINPRLKKRKLLEMPEVLNQYNEVGMVRIEVCINAQGKVISTKYNRKASETRDVDLIEQATKFAKRYRFAKSHLSRQCGHIVFDFK